MKKRRYRWLVEGLVNERWFESPKIITQHRRVVSTHKTEDQATAAWVAETLNNTEGRYEWLQVTKRRIRLPHRSKK